MSNSVLELLKIINDVSCGNPELGFIIGCLGYESEGLLGFHIVHEDIY